MRYALVAIIALLLVLIGLLIYLCVKKESYNVLVYDKDQIGTAALDLVETKTLGLTNFENLKIISALIDPLLKEWAGTNDERLQQLAQYSEAYGKLLRDARDMCGEVCVWS